MTTPLQALRFAQAALMIWLLTHSNIAAAQTQLRAGEIVRGEFLRSHQRNEYTVSLTAGDRLRIHIESVGETLKTIVTLIDPGGSRVRYWRWSHEHDVESQPLSASGKYLIWVQNGGPVGVYTISIGTIDPTGTEIRPRSIVPQGSEGSQESID